MTSRMLTLLLLWAFMVTAPLATREKHEEGKPAASETPTCTLAIELADAATGDVLPGVISVRDEAGKRVPLSELVPRGQGVGDEFAIHNWHVLPGPAKVMVPRAKLTIKAIYGLETELGEASLDLRDKTEAKLRIPLKRFYDAHARGLQSANTHVHLQKLSLKESDRYLLEVARAERLEVVYISYLERAEADLEYTSNKYTIGDLRKLTERSRGEGQPKKGEGGQPPKSPRPAGQPEHVHGPGGHEHGHTHPHPSATEFDNGQEHRHNFAGFGEGYGHVMLLHLPGLIQPVSIGPGITKQGTDAPALQRGIDKARGLGSTIIWCHNQWGLEDIPNWLGGKLHANNIFDGGTHGSYKHSFYRYLNAGLKVPFSTGTDWFIYDFSRVYVVADEGKVGADQYLTSEQWLDHLAAGRSFITNGPLLEFTVNGRRLGDTLDLKQPGKVKVAGRALGRLNFQRIELIRNGEVVKTADSRPQGGHFVAELDVDLSVDRPCWLALRTPPPSAPRDAEFQRKTPLNEYGRELFAHTSAVYVNLAGRGVFDVTSAKSLLQEMKTSRDFIREHATFANDQERVAVLRVYDEGIRQMQQRIDAAPRTAP
jgi:hypothetical protein